MSILAHLIREEITSSTRKQFSEYGWCARIINDNTLIPIRTVHQDPAPNIPSKLMSSTLRDHDAILAVQSFYLPPHADTSRSTSIVSMGSPTLSGELHTLYALGTGVSGHAGIAHGGLTATLLDQQTGSLLIEDPATPQPRTIYCHIRYLQPIVIPGAVLVRAWKSRQEGRKHWVSAEIRNGEGAVLASAESLYVNLEAKL